MSSKRNPYEKVCTDEMTIQRASGQILGPFKGTLSPNLAVIFEEDLDVEKGDEVLRELPNGKVESYTITEANYSVALLGIPPRYILTVQKTRFCSRRCLSQSVSLPLCSPAPLPKSPQTG